MPFHGLLLVGTDGLGKASVMLSPAGLNTYGVVRPYVEADTWGHFRFRSFKFRLIPGSLAAAVAWMGGVQDSTPSSSQPVMEMMPSQFISSIIQTIPPYMSVPKADLAGPFPWYKSIPGTADPTEEAPGLLVVTSGASVTVVIEVDGVIEFKTAISTVATPEEADLRRKLQELRLRQAQAKIANSGIQATAAVLAAAVGAPSVPPGPSTRLLGK